MLKELNEILQKMEQAVDEGNLVETFKLERRYFRVYHQWSPRR